MTANYKIDRSIKLLRYKIYEQLTLSKTSNVTDKVWSDLLKQINIETINLRSIYDKDQ